MLDQIEMIMAVVGGAATSTGLPRYYLNDTFSVALTAGNVDGTPAQPGPGTRSTGATSSISGGNYVLSGAADDSLWYDKAITRRVGQVVAFTPTITLASTTVEFGFDTDQAGALAANAIRMASDLLKPYDGGVAGPQIYVPADATEYSLAVALSAAGASYFLDGNLLYKGGTNATATLYAGIANTSATGTVDVVRAPQTLWAPTPIAADTGEDVPVIEDAGDNELNGTAVNVGLGGPGVGATFGGVLDIYSASLNTLFDPDEATIILNIEADWTLISNGNALVVYADGNNRINVTPGGVSGRCTMSWRAQNDIEYQRIEGLTGSHVFGMTRTITSDIFQAFSDGLQVGSDQNNLTAWAGDLDQSNCVVGSTNISGTDFAGTIRDLIISLNGAIATPEEVATISGHISDPDTNDPLTTTILDGIFGTDNYMWLPMDELYTTDGGTLTGIEAGGDGETWNGDTWSNGVDGAKNTPGLGAEEDSGTLTVGDWYSITASQTDYFYTGSAVGNTFEATATTALDASNKVKVIPSADLFRSIATAASPYVYASANWIVTAGTQAGIVTNLDSASTPANFIIVYHDGTSVIVEKCVGDTYTTLGTIAATYSADAPLVVRTLPSGSDLSVWVWYNGAYIANYTVTDTGIVDNDLHGLFSTSDDNVCSNVAIYKATDHNIPGA